MLIVLLYVTLIAGASAACTSQDMKRIEIPVTVGTLTLELGNLFDARTGTVHPSKLWSTTDIKANTGDPITSGLGGDGGSVTSSVISKKTMVAEMNAYAKVNYLGATGSVDVDFELSKNTDDLSFSFYSYRQYHTKQVSLNTEIQASALNLDALKSSPEPTHVVESIVYGSRQTVQYDLVEHTNSTDLTVGVDIDAKYKNIAEGGVEVDVQDSTLNKLKSLQVSYKTDCPQAGDSRSGVMEGQTFADVLTNARNFMGDDFDKNLRACNDGMGVPIYAHLVPICKYTNQGLTTRAVGASVLAKMESAIVEMWDADVKFKRYAAVAEYYGLRTLQWELESFRDTLNVYVLQLQSNIKTFIPEYRGGSVEVGPIVDAIERHTTSPFSKRAVDNYLDVARDLLNAVKRTVDGLSPSLSLNIGEDAQKSWTYGLAVDTGNFTSSFVRDAQEYVELFDEGIVAKASQDPYTVPKYLMDSLDEAILVANTSASVACNAGLCAWAVVDLRSTDELQNHAESGSRVVKQLSDNSVATVEMCPSSDDPRDAQGKCTLKFGSIADGFACSDLRYPFLTGTQRGCKNFCDMGYCSSERAEPALLQTFSSEQLEDRADMCVYGESLNAPLQQIKCTSDFRSKWLLRADQRVELFADDLMKGWCWSVSSDNSIVLARCETATVFQLARSDRSYKISYTSEAGETLPATIGAEQISEMTFRPLKPLLKDGNSAVMVSLQSLSNASPSDMATKASLYKLRQENTAGIATVGKHVTGETPNEGLTGRMLNVNVMEDNKVQFDIRDQLTDSERCLKRVTGGWVLAPCEQRTAFTLEEDGTIVDDRGNCVTVSSGSSLFSPAASSSCDTFPELLVRDSQCAKCDFDAGQVCVREGSNATCQCRKGFTENGDACEPVANACATTKCGKNEMCVNTYKEGRDSECVQAPTCPAFSRLVTSADGTPTCQACDPGTQQLTLGDADAECTQVDTLEAVKEQAWNGKTQGKELVVEKRAGSFLIPVAIVCGCDEHVVCPVDGNNEPIESELCECAKNPTVGTKTLGLVEVEGVECRSPPEAEEKKESDSNVGLVVGVGVGVAAVVGMSVAAVFFARGRSHKPAEAASHNTSVGPAGFAATKNDLAYFSDVNNL